jgi:ribosomal protein S18 acetylase RimI-like enzyme
VRIRAIKRDDANEIGAMAKDFADYLRSLGDTTHFQFNAKTFLRDGFGHNRAFRGFIAEVNGVATGYLLYHEGYDTDKAVRILYIADLYVRPEYRRQGVGRALMERAQKICKESGGKKMVWTVYVSNRTARRFYWHIGARYTKDMLLMKLPLKQLNK